MDESAPAVKTTGTVPPPAGCHADALFYSIRSDEDDPVSLKSIGIQIPSYEEISEPSSTSTIASLDRVEAGHISGWACHRNGFDGPVKAYMAVDDVVFTQIDIKTINLSPPSEVSQVCTAQQQEEVEQQGTAHKPAVKVLSFNVSFPHITSGIHTLRMFLEDVSKMDGDVSFVEAYHSPLFFEESTIDPSAKTIISRKDSIITQRNNQLTQLWNEIQTQIPWRRAEVDAAEISLSMTKEPSSPAVILVQSEPQNQDRRNAIRKTWAKTVSESDIIVNFIVDNRFSGPHKGMVDKELATYTDMVPVDLQISKSQYADRMLHGLYYAVKKYDASFYFISHDNMLIFPDNLGKFLKPLAGKGNIYMGCMKSGQVVTDEESPWFEKDFWRFGDKPSKSTNPQYPRHATGNLYGFSSAVARHLARSREVLQIYANEDTTVGAWMLGLQVTYIDDKLFCCDVSSCNAGSKTPHDKKCMAYVEGNCDGVCNSDGMLTFYKSCTQ